MYDLVSGESELKEAFYPHFYPHFCPYFCPPFFMLKLLQVESADPWVRTLPTHAHTLYEKAEDQTYLFFTYTKWLTYSDE